MTTNTDLTARRAAAITVPDAPDVRVEQASDEDPDVYVEGVAFHQGLNMNAWGLTEQGAQQIADTLPDRDVTASHPPLRDGKYDRSVFGGQGAPIGEVVATEVVTTDEAMLGDSGGYTARYSAEVTDPDAKQKYQAGLLTGDDYGVSVGIYGNPEAAVCSVCRDDMTECAHDRFEEVAPDDGAASDAESDTQIAGPLYDDAVSDHLAAVYFPAYDGATADVAAATASDTHDDTVAPTMDALAAAHGTRPSGGEDASTADADEDASETSAWSGTAVTARTSGCDGAATTVRIDSDNRDS